MVTEIENEAWQKLLSLTRQRNKHRWARFRKQQSSIPFIFADKGKQRPFPVSVAANDQKFAVYVFRLLKTNGSLLFRFSVCRKQREVCRFRFPFAENKRKLPFSVRSFICLRNSGNVETWAWRHEYMETWRHGVMVTWRWRPGDMEIWTWRQQTENGSLNDFPESVYRLLIVLRNKRKLSVCKRAKPTKPTCLSMNNSHDRSTTYIS